MSDAHLILNLSELTKAAASITEAKEQLKEIVSFDPSFDKPEMLDSIFEESGTEGLILWLIHWLQTNESTDFYYNVNLNYRIAGLYAFIGDSEHAIEYLEKSFETSETSVPNMKFNPVFNCSAICVGPFIGSW